MMKIRTASGKTFDIEWAAVATIDGVLRFEIIGASFAEVFATFIREENCGTLTRVWDGVEKEYTGYIKLYGINLNAVGNIVVAMEKP